MSTLKFAVAIFLGLALPVAAFAQTSTSNAQLSALLAELAQLQQQITAAASSGSQTTATTNTSNTASTSVSSSTTSTPNSCPDLTQTLSLGSSGAQVVALQTYLAQQGIFSGQVTGYFGAITQTSVGQWQETNGIVAGGDANSTGLGVVGPKTRNAISEMCSGGAPAQTQCLNIKPPTADCGTGWQPVLDAAGCAMYFQCVVQLPNSSQASSGTTVAATSSTSVSTACPVVTKPICTGTVQPYQTNANGCVTSYICSL